MTGKQQNNIAKDSLLSYLPYQEALNHKAWKKNPKGK